MSCMSNGCQVTGNSNWTGQVDWSADAPAMYNRLWSFVWWKYEAKGVLYWSMNQVNYSGGGAPYNNIWNYGSNGDGHLMYPGVATSSGRSIPASTPVIGGVHDIPIESIRLKHIRDGMEDLEYMERAKAATSKAAVDSIVDSAFTNTDIRFSYYNLNLDSGNLFHARERLASLIPADPPPLPPQPPTNLRITSP